jgi:hypothetical protein
VIQARRRSDVCRTEPCTGVAVEALLGELQVTLVLGLGEQLLPDLKGTITAWARR